MTEPGPSRLLRAALVAATFVVLGAIAWVLASVVRSTMAPGEPKAPAAAPAVPSVAAPTPEPPTPDVGHDLAPVPDEILRVGGEVSAPVRLAGPAPRYTEIARRARVQGVVILEAIIDRDGRVAKSHVLKPLPLGLDRAAQEAVQAWRFRPAMRGGQPVSVYFVLTVEFRLPDA